MLFCLENEKVFWYLQKIWSNNFYWFLLCCYLCFTLIKIYVFFFILFFFFCFDIIIFSKVKIYLSSYFIKSVINCIDSFFKKDINNKRSEIKFKIWLKLLSTLWTDVMYKCICLLLFSLIHLQSTLHSSLYVSIMPLLHIKRIDLHFQPQLHRQFIKRSLFHLIQQSSLYQ